ncbi:MAG: UDP-N-acetylglucosamine 2-epimerase (non-hydrolyzing) [Cyclobacteriaceae bacterium]
MKIITVIGARPQFIKAAPLSKVFQNSKDINELLIHTGQHYDENMSSIFFKDMGIPRPKYQLNIGSGTHGYQTGNMLIEIEKILLEERPDFTLVYGDTNSTLAGALASGKLNIPVVHVEAGLRSFDTNMPEEKNRVIVDHISSLLCATSDESLKNLSNEGIAKEKVRNVGDIMYDSFLMFREYAVASALESRDYVLVTIHRAENTDVAKKLTNIVEGLLKISKSQKVIFPLHPRTKAKLVALGLYDKLSASVELIEPVGFLEMLSLLNNAQLVMTDSGGLQKEAYYARKLCLTLRDSTEWVETINHGYNSLVDVSDFESIVSAYNQAKSKLDGITWKEGIYGQGNSSKKILENILAL